MKSQKQVEKRLKQLQKQYKEPGNQYDVELAMEIQTLEWVLDK